MFRTLIQYLWSHCNFDSLRHLRDTLQQSGASPNPKTDIFCHIIPITYNPTTYLSKSHQQPTKEKKFITISQQCIDEQKNSIKKFQNTWSLSY